MVTVVAYTYSSNNSNNGNMEISTSVIYRPIAILQYYPKPTFYKEHDSYGPDCKILITMIG